MNVLVIGGGSIGERHLRCFQTTGRADVSLCEINDEVRHWIESQLREMSAAQPDARPSPESNVEVRDR